MKKIIYTVLFLSTLYLLNACKHSEHSSTSAQEYICPMHPQIIKDEPGTCPICFMDLVPISEGSDFNGIYLNESQILLANIQTAPLHPNLFGSSRILNGRILANPKAAGTISSRFSGRVEK